MSIVDKTLSRARIGASTALGATPRRAPNIRLAALHVAQRKAHRVSIDRLVSCTIDTSMVVYLGATSAKNRLAGKCLFPWQREPASAS
jgi:hypothetical protein